MKEELFERRSEMLISLSKMFPLKLIVDTLSEKYRVKKRQIYKDWETRDKWMPQIMRKQSSTINHELIEGIRQVIPRLWVEAERGDNSSARVAALMGLLKAYVQFYELLQSSGIIEKVPEKLEHKVVNISAWDLGNVNHFLKPIKKKDLR